MVRLARDPDRRIQDSALCFLAYNHVESAIPEIAQYAHAADENHRDVRCVLALRWYSSQTAIQELNPLLVDSSYWVRLNTADTLREMRAASPSSLPYLMMSLLDPDDQLIIPHHAYATIHQIVPDLGPADYQDYFVANQQKEVDSLHAWWSQILSGKAVAGSVDYRKLMAALPRTPGNNVQFLFSPNKLDRERAIKSLAGTSDSSMIPYFVLALRDPDDTVAYAAYASLEKLLPKTFAPVTRPEFASTRGGLIKSAEGWWRDELLGKHLPATGN